MDLYFVDCVPYLFCDGGAWGLGCGSLIFQWHTPFGGWFLATKNRLCCLCNKGGRGYGVCYWAMANGALSVCGFAALGLVVFALAVLGLAVLS